MGKPKVLLLGEIEQFVAPLTRADKPPALPKHTINVIFFYSAHKSWAALSKLADLLEPKAKCRAEFFAECRSGRLDGVFIVFRTFNSIEITGLFDEELLRELPASVKFVCHNGTLSIQSGRKTDLTSDQGPATTRSTLLPAPRAASACPTRRRPSTTPRPTATCS